MSLSLILLCLLFATSIAVGQVLFKLAANAMHRIEGDFILGVVLSPSAWLAFGWYAASSFLWIYILMRVPLSRAYPFALLGSALVPLLSWVFFRERITFSYVAGTLIILVGLYIIFAPPLIAGRPRP